MMRKIALNPFVMSLLLAGATVPHAYASDKPMRAMQVDLDYVYDADPSQTERNLDLLVERVAEIRPAAIFLQAFADPQGTGLASETYFPNRHLPVRADLFAHAVEELKQRTQVQVFGWLPVLSFALANNAEMVQAWSPTTGAVAADPKAYHRLSPFDAMARANIIEIYEDMAKAAPIDGILFHDDATLSDFEDAAPSAMKSYKAAGLPASIETLRSDATTLQAWSDFKTDYLIRFTKMLAAHARHFRPNLLTARNIYAPVMLEPQSKTWFAQDYNKFLAAYDYTAVEAMPRMEKVSDDESHEWLSKLIAVSADHPQGLKHTIFELQAVDWNLAAEGKDRAIPEETLGAQMRLLARHGAMNFAYYPDDFVTDTPKIALLRKEFSLPNDAETP